MHCKLTHNGFQLVFYTSFLYGAFLAPIGLLCIGFSMVSLRGLQLVSYILASANILAPGVRNSTASIPSYWFPVSLSKKGGCLVRWRMLCFDHALEVLLNLRTSKKHVNVLIKATTIKITSAALPSPPLLLASTAALYVAKRT